MKKLLQKIDKNTFSLVKWRGVTICLTMFYAFPARAQINVTSNTARNSTPPTGYEDGITVKNNSTLTINGITLQMNINNLLGALVFEHSCNKSAISLDVQNYTESVYFMEIDLDNGQHLYNRFVIQH
ncbi:MAG: hypothetical protein M9892_02990 [Bacteroidetes bacterium]|nr:hypothetical protein [Bacteroidota bacterium]